jgi:hypothetical protein
LRVYHQKPIARAYEHLRLAASPPSKIKLLLLVLLIMIMIRIILMVIFGLMINSIFGRTSWDVTWSSNIFQVDHAHDPHCLSSNFVIFAGRLPLRPRAANDTCSIPPRSASAPYWGPVPVAKGTELKWQMFLWEEWCQNESGSDQVCEVMWWKQS